MRKDLCFLEKLGLHFLVEPFWKTHQERLLQARQIHQENDVNKAFKTMKWRNSY
jgi:hypothetical protein